MESSDQIDLRGAINAVSDVVQNRPRPLRDFDQIFMKAGDMVLQSELVARWADGKRLAFIGDGDAISICVAYLRHKEILRYGPREIVVYDFDERICTAVQRFADRERIDGLGSVLYNCLDPFPGPSDFDTFYTNPPWGASNGGESVNVFGERGMEALGYSGEGMIVIADDPELEWTGQVLANLQAMVLKSGFVVRRLMPQLHSYHLDDAPELRSCNVIVRSNESAEAPAKSEAITNPDRLRHFYGKDNPPRVRYVRERARLDWDKANENEYRLEHFEEDHG